MTHRLIACLLALAPVGCYPGDICRPDVACPLSDGDGESIGESSTGEAASCQIPESDECIPCGMGEWCYPDTLEPCCGQCTPCEQGLCSPNGTVCTYCYDFCPMEGQCPDEEGTCPGETAGP